MDQGDKPNVIFSWKAHPARQYVGRACLGLVVISLAGLGVAVAAGHPAWGLLGAMALVISLQRFYFPSTFTIDEEGITASFLLTTKRARWCAIRRFVKDDAGGYLGSRAKRSWIDAYRGLHVIWGEKREEAVSAIEARLAAPRSAAQGSASAPANSQQPATNSGSAMGAHA